MWEEPSERGRSMRKIEGEEIYILQGKPKSRGRGEKQTASKFSDGEETYINHQGMRREQRT